MDNEKTRICPYCKQEVKMKVGFHNWKNLFRKPTIEEAITLFIILMEIALFFAWQHDINQYQKYIKENCNPLVVRPLNPATATNDSWINTTYINDTNRTYSV